MATVPPRPLLVELFVEELPPKALPKLAAAFADGIAAGLRAESLLDDERRRHVVRDAAPARRADRRGGRARRRSRRSRTS